jgi:hypothetical protein
VGPLLGATGGDDSISGKQLWVRNVMGGVVRVEEHQFFNRSHFLWAGRGSTPIFLACHLGLSGACFSLCDIGSNP